MIGAPVERMVRSCGTLAQRASRAGLTALDGPRYPLAGALALTVVVERSHRRAGVRGLIAVVVADATVHLALKPLVGRGRPTSGLPRAGRGPLGNVRRSPTSSFPSAHAADAFAFACAAGSAAPDLRCRLLLLAATVSYSRLRIGVHHASDVVAGAFVGIVAARAVTELCRREGPAPGDEGIPRRRAPG